MSFLCKTFKKQKEKVSHQKKKKIPFSGRITGSDSIDTLDRIYIEKESGVKARLSATKNFTACTADELNLSVGQRVWLLYQENDWLYVIDDEGQEGFVPSSFCKFVRSDSIYEAISDKAEISEYETGHERSSRKGSRNSGDVNEPRRNSIKNDSELFTREESQSSFAASKSFSKSLPDIIAEQHHQGHLSNRNINATLIAQQIKPQINEQCKPKQSQITKKIFEVEEISLTFPRGNKEALQPTTITKTRGIDGVSGSPSFGTNNASRFSTNHMSVEVKNIHFQTTGDMLFKKIYLGQMNVSYDFEAIQNNDVGVRRGEAVIVLNKDDPDWYWVQRENGQEGFVPSNYLSQATESKQHSYTGISETAAADQASLEIMKGRNHRHLSQQNRARVPPSDLDLYALHTHPFVFAQNNQVVTNRSTQIDNNSYLASGLCPEFV